MLNLQEESVKFTEKSANFTVKCKIYRKKNTEKSANLTLIK